MIRQPTVIYLIGSLRNPMIPEIGESLREDDYEVFDDWHSVGPHADDHWRDYELYRGRSYKDALQGHAAVNTFQFDKRHLERADVGVLVQPAGKSAHLELGWLLGKGKRGFVLFPDGEPERWDVMYQFADDICFSIEELKQSLRIR